MISVVIPTRNRADILLPALQSLLTQTLDTDCFEILVIDNGSTDHTAEVVDGFRDQLPNLRYIHAPEPGLHVGRHRGMREATGDVLVFADDDIEAHASWLETLADIFSDGDVAMAGGNCLPLFLEPPPPWLESLWNRRQDDGTRSLPSLSIQERPAGRYDFSPYQVWGCNFAIRKDVLLSSGGFHPDGMPKELIRFRGDGETHVSRYVVDNGLKCVFDSGASVHHKVTPGRMTHAYFRQRGFNQGVSDSYTHLRAGSGPKGLRRTVVYKAARWGWHKLRRLRIKPALAREAQLALDEERAGYSEGYSYHQLAYQDDPEVRAWVHQQDYFGEIS